MVSKVRGIVNAVFNRECVSAGAQRADRRAELANELGDVITHSHLQEMRDKTMESR